MKKDDDFGLYNLLAKTLAVITASFSTLIASKTEAIPLEEGKYLKKVTSYGEYQEKVLKSKYVLRKKVNEDGYTMAKHVSHSSHRSHTSHRSHRSHSSHSSHSSSNHSSHYSSNHSSHYSSSTTPPKKETPPKSELKYFVLGSRTMKYGDQGTDVLAAQNYLIKKGYQVSTDGKFSFTMEIAVKLFQEANELSNSGVIDEITLYFLMN